jgi:hypothetical protein
MLDDLSEQMGRDVDIAVVYPDADAPPIGG